MEERLFDYFKENRISTREELRTLLTNNKTLIDELGINNVIVEGYFKKYKDGSKAIIQLPVSKVVVLNDVHIPYHNVVFMENFYNLLRDEQPDKIVLNGDMLDFYDLSSFDKDPARVNRLQEELDLFHSVLSFMKKCSPNSEIIPIIGNHEDRLRRFLWKNPEIASLRDLDINKLLRLEELGIQNFVKSYWIGEMEFTHGKVVRKHSSYSAKCEYEDRNHSGISGHTHRLGSFYKTVEGKTYGWFENGCGCELTPSYIDGTPNWQNGFSVIYFEGNEAFDVHQVYSHNGTFRYNGKAYKW